MRYHTNSTEQKCVQFSTNLPDVVDAIFHAAKRVATTLPRRHATDYKGESVCNSPAKPAKKRDRKSTRLNSSH